ncbi:MAG: hypothetical protein AAGH68_07350 [Pseudomonadota bacterium]
MAIGLSSPNSHASETEVQLTEGNIVLSNQDGSQITMAPGSDVALSKDADGTAVVTLNGGDVYLSNVLQRDGKPLRLRMGDEVVEINRASVIVNRAGGNMDVTMLHGRRVSFGGGATVLTQAGTRIRMGGGGAPKVDRPSAAQMSALKGSVGILSGKPLGARPNEGRPRAQGAQPPKPPQSQVPGQIQQQIAAKPPRQRNNGPMPPAFPNLPGLNPPPPSGGPGPMSGEPPKMPGGMPPGMQPGMPPGMQPSHPNGPGGPPPPANPFPNLPPGFQPPGA